MPFQELVDAIVTDSDLLGAIDQLLAIKRAVGEENMDRLFRSSMPSLMPNFRGWKPSCRPCCATPITQFWIVC